MKKVILFIATILLVNRMESQLNWETTGNTVGPTTFFGGINNAPVPFKTNAITRMIIGDGTTAPSQGYIGMGDNLGTTFVPTARLHLHESNPSFLGGAPAPYLRFTTGGPVGLGTGTTATDGYEMGIGLLGDAHLINREQNQPISIHTNDGGTAGTYFERLRFNAFNNNGFIGVGNAGNFTAASQVHINTIGANGAIPANFGNMFRSDGLQTLQNQWEMWTGTTIANTTQKGVLLTGPNANIAVAPLILPNNQNFAYNHFVMQATAGDIIFNASGNQTSAGVAGAISERMRITAVNYSEPNLPAFNPAFVTRVSISSGEQALQYTSHPDYIASPLAMLQIGDAWERETGGHRDWMRYGIFSTHNQDGMFMGQRSTGCNYLT